MCVYMFFTIQRRWLGKRRKKTGRQWLPRVIVSPALAKKSLVIVCLWQVWLSNLSLAIFAGNFHLISDFVIYTTTFQYNFFSVSPASSSRSGCGHFLRKSSIEFCKRNARKCLQHNPSPCRRDFKWFAVSNCGILIAFTSRASGKSTRVRLPNRTGALDRHFAHWSSISTRWHRISQRSSLAGQFSSSLVSATFRRPPHCSVISQIVAKGNRFSGRHIDRNWKFRTNVRNYVTEQHYTPRDNEYQHWARNTQTRNYSRPRARNRDMHSRSEVMWSVMMWRELTWFMWRRGTARTLPISR